MRKLSFSTFAGALLLGAAVLTSAPARSQSTPAGSEASQHADALFRTGKELYKSGKLLEAYEAYRAAWRLKQTYDIATNLANTEFQLAKMRDAAEHYAFSIKNFPPTGGKAQLEAIKGQFDEVRRQVGALAITVNVEGAEVSIDGASIGRAPFVDEQYVAPGARTVVAKLSGYEPVKQTIQVAKGAAQPVTLTLVAVAAAPSSTGEPGAGPAVGTTVAPTRDRAPARSIVPGVVLGGVAGAALVTGVALLIEGGLKRGDAHDVSDAIRSAQHSCVTGAGNFDPRCPQLNDTALSAGTFHNVGVGFVVGASAVAVGSAAYFLWPMLTSRRPSALRVSPAMSATDAGLLFSGTF